MARATAQRDGRAREGGDRHVWLRFAATLLRLLSLAALALGLSYALIVSASARQELGGLGTISALVLLAFGTLCTVVGNLAFAQAIDAFARWSARGDASDGATQGERASAK